MSGMALTRKCFLCAGTPTNWATPVVGLQPSPLSWEVGSIFPSSLMSSIGDMRKLVPKSQSRAVMEPGFECRPGNPEPGLADSGSSPLSQSPWVAFCPFLQAQPRWSQAMGPTQRGRRSILLPTQAPPSLGAKQTKPRVSVLSGDFPNVPGLFPGGGTRNKQARDPETEMLKMERRKKQP